MRNTPQRSQKLLRAGRAARKSTTRFVLVLLLLTLLSSAKRHYIDRTGFEASNDAGETEGNRLNGDYHDKHWKTATTSGDYENEVEPHGDADEDDLASIKDRLEKKLQMQQGIAVNLETPEVEKPQNQTSQGNSTLNPEDEEATNLPEEQNEEEESQPEVYDKNNKRRGKNHDKKHQKIIGQGIHKEVWNEKTEEYESSFKAYIRQQTEKDMDKSMFEFETFGEDKELVMTRNNSKVLVTLCVCALLGGIVAGLIIRYLMRKFFPQDPVEQSPMISQKSGKQSTGKLSLASKATTCETSRETFQNGSQRQSKMELV